MPSAAMMDTFREVMQAQQNETALLENFKNIIDELIELSHNRGATVERLAQAHFGEMEKLKQQHAKEMDQLRVEYEKKLDEMKINTTAQANEELQEKSNEIAHQREVVSELRHANLNPGILRRYEKRKEMEEQE